MCGKGKHSGRGKEIIGSKENGMGKKRIRSEVRKKEKLEEKKGMKKT